jgi:hypothetical protein
MRRSTSTVLALLAVPALTAALASAAGDGHAPGGHSDDRVRPAGNPYDVTLQVPDGWHVSRDRLVTDLLMPREVVSVGTFGMAPGGGGNCGREPVAALRRMGPGDALVTVQEYFVDERMRSRFRRRYPVEPTLGRLTRSAEAQLYFATIPFQDQGRVFDVLVYFSGRPGPERRAEVERLLSGLDFGHDPVGFGADV